MSENKVYRNNLKVYFSDYINDESTILLIQNLEEAANYAKSLFATIGRVPHVELHIDSCGGHVGNSFSISNYIKSSDVVIDTYADGMCASGASLILLSGKNRYMSENSFILIHQLSWVIGGNHEQLADQMKMSDVMMKKITNFYLSHTLIPKKKLKKILRKDQFLSTDFCLRYNLVDEVINMNIENR
jgi:ATP-dependent protease ClpP protease subunit